MRWLPAASAWCQKEEEYKESNVSCACEQWRSAWSCERKYDNAIFRIRCTASRTAADFDDLKCNGFAFTVAIKPENERLRAARQPAQLCSKWLLIFGHEVHDGSCKES